MRVRPTRQLVERSLQARFSYYAGQCLQYLGLCLIGGKHNDRYLLTIGYCASADRPSTGHDEAHQEHPAGYRKAKHSCSGQDGEDLKLPVVLTSSQEANLQGPLMPELEQI